MEKKKVVIISSPLNIGGFDIVATNLQKNLDKDKFECTYCLRGEEIGVLEDEVVAGGAKIIHQPNNTKNYFKSYFYYKKFFSENDFDIVHSHLMFYSGIVMRAAYKAGIKKRVPHSHMTNPCIENRSTLKKIIAETYSFVMKRWLVKYSTDLVACGKEAGEYLYGKKNFAKRGVLLNNGTYLDKFEFEQQKRDDARKEFNLQNSIVLGHIGRLNYVKNHSFLLDVFFEFQKQYSNSKLLIVGDGEQRPAIEAKAKSLGIDDKVIITGLRQDVDKLAMAMDVFVFPSLYEGFPMTLVEAQATKLPCLISDTVTRSAKLIEPTQYLSLNDSPTLWAQKAYELSQIDREGVDTSTLKKNFDIKSVAKQLENIYLS